MYNRFYIFFIVFILSISEVSCMLSGGLKSLKEQDAQFRASIVGKSQVEIETETIKAKNSVFILFTPTQGTPQMISEKGDIPEGLIPAARLASYETSVKPRVDTTHQMPSAGVNSVFIRYKKHRPQVDNQSQAVDETHYNELLTAHKTKIVEKVLDETLFKKISANDMPAAFYYYISEGKDSPEFAAIFGKQINSTMGNKLSGPGVYYNRKQDLKNVNTMLSKVGFKPVEELLNTRNMQTESQLLGSFMEKGFRRSARLATL